MESKSYKVKLFYVGEENRAAREDKINELIEGYEEVDITQSAVWHEHNGQMECLLIIKYR